MRWYPWPSEAISKLRVWIVYWTGHTNRWQTNDRGHSGSGGAWGGAILLSPWELIIIRWQLWTRYCQKMQWSLARPHLPFISQHLLRICLQFVFKECHAPCKWNLGPNFIWFASPATQWPSVLLWSWSSQVGVCYPNCNDGLTVREPRDMLPRWTLPESIFCIFSRSATPV